MWFKNAQIYSLQLTDEQKSILRDDSRFEALLQSKPFHHCQAQELSTIGFAPLFGRAAPVMAFSTGPHHFMRLIEESKLLPSTVIRQVLDEEIDQKQADLGRDLQKNEIKTLKTAVTSKLLEQAFSCQREMLVYINSDKNFAVVSVSSAKRAEKAIAMLREAFYGSFKARPYQPRCPVQDRMTSWIKNQELPEDITLGTDATLKSSDDVGATVRVARDDLQSEEIQTHINAGKVITEIQLIFREDVSFVLTADLVLKRVRPEDQYMEKTLPDSSDDPVLDAQALLIMQAEIFENVVAALIRIFDCDA